MEKLKKQRAKYARKTFKLNIRLNETAFNLLQTLSSLSSHTKTAIVENALSAYGKATLSPEQLAKALSSQSPKEPLSIGIDFEQSKEPLNPEQSEPEPLSDTDNLPEFDNLSFEPLPDFEHLPEFDNLSFEPEPLSPTDKPKAKTRKAKEPKQPKAKEPKQPKAPKPQRKPEPLSEIEQLETNLQKVIQLHFSKGLSVQTISKAIEHAEKKEYAETKAALSEIDFKSKFINIAIGLCSKLEKAATQTSKKQPKEPLSKAPKPEQPQSPPEPEQSETEPTFYEIIDLAKAALNLSSHQKARNSLDFIKIYFKNGDFPACIRNINELREREQNDPASMYLLDALIMLEDLEP